MPTVLLAHGKVLPTVVTAAMVILIGIGLAVELRNSAATEPRLLGWDQDERQRSIHQQSLALVGVCDGRRDFDRWVYRIRRIRWRHGVLADAGPRRTGGCLRNRIGGLPAPHLRLHPQDDRRSVITIVGGPESPGEKSRFCVPR